MRGMTALVGTAAPSTRQTAASTASMPNARSRRRGQSPQPRSGAPQAQGLTPAPRTAAPSTAPSRATRDPSERNTPRLAGSWPPAATTGISTILTDVTHANSEPAIERHGQAFVKTFKRDYARVNPRPDAVTVDDHSSIP